MKSSLIWIAVGCITTFFLSTSCQSGKALRSAHKLYQSYRSGRVEVTEYFSNEYMADTSVYVRDYIFDCQSPRSKSLTNTKLFQQYYSPEGWTLQQVFTTKQLYKTRNTSPKFYEWDLSSNSVRSLNRHHNKLPFINTPTFFFALRGRFHHLASQDSAQWVVKAGPNTVWIDKQSSQITRYRLNMNTREGVYYEDYHISYQDYNRPAYRQDSIYDILNYASAQGQLSPSKNWYEPIDSLTLSQGIPTWVLPNASGDSINSQTFEGQILIVDFWAQSCGPCLRAMSHLDKIYQQNQGRGVSVIGINPVDEWTNNTQDLINYWKISFPVVFTNGVDSTVAKGYDFQGFYPTTYLVDRQGFIVKRYIGYTPKTMNEIEHDLTELLKSEE